MFLVVSHCFLFLLLFFFFNDTATTEIYTLSLHDALPISPRFVVGAPEIGRVIVCAGSGLQLTAALVFSDRKSTRLNSSHQIISYAVFCLKKKKDHPMPVIQSSAYEETRVYTSTLSTCDKP